MTDKKKSPSNLIPLETIESRIFFIRGKKVMLDKDLSELYGVETRVLNQAVRRNILRFPDDFMIQLTQKEYDSLRSQIVTLKNAGRGQHRKYLPFVFTEQGVAMLSSVLNSEKAIMVNIQIMRTFTKLRELLSSNADIKRKIEGMEKKYDQQFKVVFDTIKRLLESPVKPRKKIGFHN